MLCVYKLINTYGFVVCRRYRTNILSVKSDGMTNDNGDNTFLNFKSIENMTFFSIKYKKGTNFFVVTRGICGLKNMYSVMFYYFYFSTNGSTQVENQHARYVEIYFDNLL